MTQAQWNIVEDKLRTLGSGVHLEIDGYHVSFYVVQYKMKLVIATYVDGYIKGEWIINDCEIRQKFYQCSKRSLLSRKGKEKLKREKKAVREEIMKKFEYQSFSPYWTSFRSLKRHLIQNNTSIELVRREQDEESEQY